MHNDLILELVDQNFMTVSHQRDYVAGSEDRVNYVLGKSATTKSSRQKLGVLKSQEYFEAPMNSKRNIQTPKKKVMRGDERKQRKKMFLKRL